jgi:ABC-type phosphate transport system permease subunit
VAKQAVGGDGKTTPARAGKAAEKVHEKAGKWIARIISTAWTVLTYFVVPILVLEGANPFQAVKQSFATVRKD